MQTIANHNKRLQRSSCVGCAWQRPETVWAADFKEQREPIEGHYGWILAVKDLTSRYQLAWLPVEEATAESSRRPMPGCSPSMAVLYERRLDFGLAALEAAAASIEDLSRDLAVGQCLLKLLHAGSANTCVDEPQPCESLQSIELFQSGVSHSSAAEIQHCELR